MLTKLQLQNIAWTSTSKSWPTLCSKSEQKFSFMTKPQLPNLQQTVANRILIININNSNNFNKFYLPSAHARVTSIKFNKQDLVSEWVTSIANDRKRNSEDWATVPLSFANQVRNSMFPHSWKYLSPPIQYHWVLTQWRIWSITNACLTS